MRVTILIVKNKSQTRRRERNENMGNFLQTVAAMACLKSLLMIFNMAFWVSFYLDFYFMFTHSKFRTHHLFRWCCSLIASQVVKCLDDEYIGAPPYSIQMYHIPQLY